jgi:hypothetical protein
MWYQNRDAGLTDSASCKAFDRGQTEVAAQKKKSAARLRFRAR